MVVGYIWLQKRVLKIKYKKIAWQAFLSPILTCIPYAILLLLFSYTLWPFMEWSFALIMDDGIARVAVAVLVLLGMLFVFPGVLFCPFYALLGGWDDYTLEEFRKTALLSGPSKFIVMIMYKISAKFAKISKLHNKFPLEDMEIVQEQINDLVKQGKAKAMMRKVK
jgi:hypothetical protein